MHLHVKKISVRNLQSFGNKTTVFDFTQGFNYILGKNGSGKSSIYTSLCFNWFGKPYNSDIKISELINDKNGGKAWTSSEFSVGGHDYIINRGLKPDILEIIKDGESLDLQSHKSLIQEEINKILGINYNLFKQIVALHLDDKDVPFLRLPKKNKDETLESIFNLVVFGKMLDSAKKEFNLKSSELESKEIERKGLLSTIEANRVSIKNLSFLKENHEKDKRARLSELKKSLSEKQSEKEQLLPKLEEINKSFNQETLDKIKKELSDLDVKINGTAQEIALLEATKYNKTFEYPEHIISLEKEINDLKTVNLTVNKFLVENKEEIDNLSSDIRRLETEIESLVSDCDFWKSAKENFKVFPYNKYPEISDKRDKIVELKSEISKRKKDLEALKTKEEGICSECYQPVSGEHLEQEITRQYGDLLVTEQLVSSLSDELKDVLKSEIESMIKSLSDKIKEKEQSLENNKKIHKDLISSLEGKWEEYKNHLQTKIETKEKSLSDKKDEFIDSCIKSIDVKISSLEKYKNSLSEERVSKRKELEKQEILRDSYLNQRSSISGNIRSIDNEISYFKTKIIEEENNNPDFSGLDATIRSTKELEVKEDEISKKINELRQDIRIYGEIKKVLDKDGIKKYFFSRLIKRLNQIINEYLKYFELNIIFEFNDLFEEKIIKENKEKSYSSFSDGERRRINTSLTLSFIALNKLINDFSCNLFFADEIFDGLDDGGLELIFEKMKEISDKENMSIYVISHKNMEGWHGIDKVITVEKTKGFTEISVK